MTHNVPGTGAAALCLVAALVLVTADARQGTSVLMGKTQMLAGGLEVTTVTPGSGNIAAASGDTVKVQYSGKLANGQVFDSGDISFPLGQGHVIKGWDLVRIILYAPFTQGLILFARSLSLVIMRRAAASVPPSFLFIVPCKCSHESKRST
jgi:hypothetical protein